MPLYPVQTRLILSPPLRNSSSAAADVTFAIAKANHVGNDDTLLAVGPIADVDVTAGARVEVIRSQINKAIAHTSMIDRNLRNSARVLHTIKLIGRSIATRAAP